MKFDKLFVTFCGHIRKNIFLSKKDMFIKFLLGNRYQNNRKKSIHVLLKKTKEKH